MRDWRTEWVTQRGSDGVRVMHKSRVMRSDWTAIVCAVLYLRKVESRSCCAAPDAGQEDGLAQLDKGESYEGRRR